MQYLLLIYFGEAWDQLSLAARQQIYGEQLQLAHQLTASGQYLVGAPLHPPSTATSVRVRDGKRLVTDGPFAETREQLGGYMLIDVTGSRRGDRHRRTRCSGPRGHRRSPAGEGRPTDVAAARRSGGPASSWAGRARTSGTWAHLRLSIRALPRSSSAGCHGRAYRKSCRGKMRDNAETGG